MFLFTLQKRKTTTISVEVKKSQHKYIIGPKGNTLQEILEATGVSVEMPPLDSSSETIILRGEPDKLGPALTQVYAKVRGEGGTKAFSSGFGPNHLFEKNAVPFLLLVAVFLSALWYKTELVQPRLWSDVAGNEVDENE